METTRIGKTLYDVDKIRHFAEKIPTIEIDTKLLENSLIKGHYFWEDINGNKLGPYQILLDWEIAQNNPNWLKHIESIKRADLNNPVWITNEYVVFDGMHRLTKAFIEKVPRIKVKIFTQLPPSAIIC
jgi:hypothetical protein